MHSAPWPFLQEPEKQSNPAGQSFAVVHVALHRPVASEHEYGEQSVVARLVQVPDPSQRAPGSDTVMDWQVALRHVVPDA